MDIRIQEAFIQDIDTLMEWRMEVLSEVFSLSKNQPMEKLARENRLYYEEAIPTGKHIDCFACLDGEIVGCGGMCLYQEMPSPDNPNGKCAYLMNIYTRPQYRKHGIGKQIVSWLVAQAKRREAVKIYLETSHAGKPLYTQMGFTDMPDMMKYPE